MVKNTSCGVNIKPSGGRTYYKRYDSQITPIFTSIQRLARKLLDFRANLFIKESI